MPPFSRLSQAAPNGKTVDVSLFNVIAYKPYHGQCKVLDEVMKDILSKLPCRAICIFASQSARPLEITKTSHTLQKGAYPIVCEKIIVNACEDDLAKVPLALMPHLLPDLPIYLLWGQNPLTELKMLPSLEKFSSRLVFDANGENGNWKNFSSMVLDYLQKGFLDGIDINWALIGSWRDAFVRLFYNWQAIEQLSYCQQLSLTYSGELSKVDATQSIYLCCWLAAQLGWKLCALQQVANGFILNYSHARGTVEILITPVVDFNDYSGTLISVAITVANGTQYRLKRNLHSRVATVHISRSDSCDLPFTIPLPALWHNLSYMKDLFHYSTSPHYRNMLHQLTTLPE